VEGLALARELERQLETTATVMLWSEGSFQPGKAVAESLTEVAERSDFAVFVLTADDMSLSHRANVFFEIGFLAGHLGLSRTFIIIGDLERTALPSDLVGAMYLRLLTSNFPDLRAVIAPAAAAIRKTMADLNTRQDRRLIEYYSCFISYSRYDQEFARRLHDDLREVGVRSWLDAKELKTGAPWREHIDKALQAHDKVLLILSKASMQSSWVRLEVKNALRLERERQKTVLFPVRLDDAIFEVSGVEEIDLLKEKQIVDFRDWQDKRLYQRAFSYLVRDLAISASVESERLS
jgi:hypothetical protein